MPALRHASAIHWLDGKVVTFEDHDLVESFRQDAGGAHPRHAPADDDGAGLPSGSCWWSHGRRYERDPYPVRS
jgi:hypothetical protein